MLFSKSISEKINSVVAPLVRKLNDVNIDLLGDEIDVLRITQSNLDIFGEYDEGVESSIISNVIIKHPWGNNVRLFTTSDKVTGQVDTNALDLWDILPFEVYVKFSGDYMTQNVSLKVGDIIVEVLQDEFNNKIPLMLQVSKIFGMFRSRFISGKRYECALYRNTLTNEMQNALNKYLGQL